MGHDMTRRMPAHFNHWCPAVDTADSFRPCLTSRAGVWRAQDVGLSVAGRPMVNQKRSGLSDLRGVCCPTAGLSSSDPPLFSVGAAMLVDQQVATTEVSTVADALRWAAGQWGASVPMAAAVDTLLHWSDGPSGWRPADRGCPRPIPNRR
jgi:hypothetical protein